MLAAGQVIHAIAVRLAGLPIGAAVATDRGWPWAEGDLPAWRVVEGDEEIETLSIHSPALQQHTLEVQLSGTVRAASAIDDSLRALAAEALTALFSTTPPADELADLASGVVLTLARIERNLAEEGQAAVGRVGVTLQALFRTLANAPETILDV